MIFAIEDSVLQIWTIHDVFKMHSKLSPPPSKRDKERNIFPWPSQFPLSVKRKRIIGRGFISYLILNTLTKFIWNESVSLLVYASWYNLNTCTLKLRVNKTNLSYARCEKPLKNHSLDVAKKCVESYSSSNTAGQYPKKKGKLTWLHY